MGITDATLALALVPLFAWGWWKTVRDYRARRISIVRAVGLAAARDDNALGYWLLTIVNAALLVGGTMIAAVWIWRGSAL